MARVGVGSWVLYYVYDVPPEICGRVCCICCSISFAHLMILENFL